MVRLQHEAEILTHRWSLSSLLTSCIASYSFCSSVMPSIGLGFGSSHLPVIGFTLQMPQRWKLNRFIINWKYAAIMNKIDRHNNRQNMSIRVVNYNTTTNQHHYYKNNRQNNNDMLSTPCTHSHGEGSDTPACKVGFILQHCNNFGRTPFLT